MYWLNYGKNAYKNVTEDGEGRRFSVINMNIGRFLNISYSTEIATWCRTNEYFFMPTVKAETKYSCFFRSISISFSEVSDEGRFL